MNYTSTSFSRQFSFLYTTIGSNNYGRTLFRFLFILLLIGKSLSPLSAKPTNTSQNFALPGTVLSESSIQANWGQPLGVSIDRFVLDVSTSSTFATFLSGYQAKDVINFSIEITGLQPAMTYYYRLRYVETGQTERSEYSNVISVTTLKRNALSALSFKDANLASLPIFPLFNKDITSYTLDTDVSTLTVTPVALDSYSTISCWINGGAQTVITDAITSVSFNLNEGLNTIEIKVAAADLGFKTYQIRVNVITPTIVTGISPTKAPPGSSITITGSRFNSTPSQNVVFFGTAKGNVTAASTTSLIVTVPNGATYSPVTVVNTATASMGYSKNFFLPTSRVSKPTLELSDFSPKIDIGIPSQSFQRADIMDVNNDTKPDIIWPSYYDTTSVLQNNSTSGALVFPEKSANFLHSSQSRVKAADINGDGKPDILGTRDNSFLFNTNSNTSLSFETYNSGLNNSLSSELIYDIDGDGKPDAILNENNNLSIRRNITVGNSGAFGTPFQFNSGETVNAIGDMDGDGKPDLVVVGNNGVGVMRNTSKIGRISFESAVFTSAPNFFNFILGDIDGDGKLDMVGLYSSGKKIAVFRNTTTSGVLSFVVTEFTTTYNPSAMTLGDINGDGKPDLAVAVDTYNGNDYRVSAILNKSETGDIKFDTSVDIFVAPSPGTQVYIVDMDNNGRPDLSVVNFYAKTISILSYQPPFSNNVNLSALTTNLGSLNPIFKSTDTTYSVTLDEINTSLSVTATAADEKQTLRVRVNGGEYALMSSGTPSVVLLHSGTNKIEINVLAENGITNKTYTISVLMPFAPPGKALKFTATNQYLETYNSTDSPSFTLEAWIRSSTDSPQGTYAYEGAVLFSADVSGDANDFVMSVLNNTIAFHDGNAAVTTRGKTVVTDGRWHHVAVVREEGVAIRIYIDGMLDQTGTAGIGLLKAKTSISLGGIERYLPAAFTGSMDEVRIWKKARTGVEIAQNFSKVVDATDENLQTYLNFDMESLERNPVLTKVKGTGYGYNLDQSGSNWVDSYAMVIPGAAEATNVSTSGFTAKWQASLVGEADSYLLQVSTDPDFDSFVDGYSGLTVTGKTSVAVTIPTVPNARTAATGAYYYRVSASKTGVEGQGAFSPTVTVYLSPLPVTLISFTGKKVENGNLLTWQVTDEKNFADYEIERSFDAKKFERIGQLNSPASSRAGRKDYTFTDENTGTITPSALLYYRLKMVDEDGSFAYSRILSIENYSNQGQVGSVYPNPAVNKEVFVDITPIQSGNWQIGILKTTGQMISSERINLQKGLNTVRFNLNGLSAGVHLIQFDNGTQQVVRKIVVK